MAYEPTFSIDSIGRDEPKALEIGIEAMGFLLEALVKVDRSHLRRFSKTTPPLYKSGAKYDPLDPPEGSACGDDKWADIATILEAKETMGPDGEPLLDCEDAACWRAAECNQIYRVGLEAPAIKCKCCNGTGLVLREVEPYVFLRRDWIRDDNGQKRRRHLYHVVDLWPEGLKRYPNTVHRTNDGLLIEDPSKVLGM
jgi:hypothetical protein